MKRMFVLSALVACLGQPAHADPIHAIAGGAFWHHDSGWEFPRKCGEFELVGIPQDVAGSRDAVAYYAAVVDGARIVASVDVYPADSAAAEGMTAEGTGNTSSESPFVVDAARSPSGTRRVFSVGEKDAHTVTYFMSAGDWRVRIRVEALIAQMLPMVDAFAREQRWASLTGAPTPR